jgi:hypothetical protein
MYSTHPTASLNRDTSAAGQRALSSRVERARTCPRAGVELDHVALDPWRQVCQKHGFAISLHVKPLLKGLWSRAGQYGGYVGCAFVVKAFGRVQDGLVDRV